MATIEYFKDNQLCYSSRRRYSSIPSSISAFSTETQKSVLLNDGAFTTIKTSASNLCDYVKIDGTRWFVVGYEFLNGGQIRLFLQRDVIGEIGISSFYGKIERGYTDTFIKYRKELSLNQRLISRTRIKSQSTKYGNYNVSSHDNEMWGILYFSKPNGQSTSINIPTLGYNANIYGYPYIANNAYKQYEIDTSETYINIFVTLKSLSLSYGGNRTDTRYYKLSFELSGSPTYTYIRLNELPHSSYVINLEAGVDALNAWDSIVSGICNNILASVLIEGSGYNLPSTSLVDASAIPYNNIVIEHEVNGSIEYLQYTTEDTHTYVSGHIDFRTLNDTIKSAISNVSFVNNISENSQSPMSLDFIRSTKRYKTYRYHYTDVTNQINSGTISINASQLFVDEPYFVCVMPLYDVVLTEGINSYSINKNIAMNLFNNIILQTSGSDGLLVDAQIYPYCPDLLSINAELTYTKDEVTYSIPIFNIYSTHFDVDCLLTLNVNVDIKKEYIENELSIVTPANTSKFNFNFYDYYNNGNTIKIKIKTALKPFNIISSAVIQPDSSSLVGMTYSSDLRGCSSSGSEFECSLASNAYETYMRQNSNYQQMFELDKQELEYQHKIEKINEITQAVTNTITATTMGAIGGKAIGGNVGAAVGGAAAGLTVGTTMTIQAVQNEKIRQYEEDLQQQRFDLTIGTIKNLPNSVNRISSFNEIVMQDFCYVIERYECSEDEKDIVDQFIDNYGYGIGVYGFFTSFKRNNGFLKGALIQSNLIPSLHNIASKELAGGIYIYE